MIVERTLGKWVLGKVALVFSRRRDHGPDPNRRYED